MYIFEEVFKEILSDKDVWNMSNEDYSSLKEEAKKTVAWYNRVVDVCDTETGEVLEEATAYYEVEKKYNIDYQSGDVVYVIAG